MPTSATTPAPSGDIPFVSDQIVEHDASRSSRSDRRRRSDALRPILWRLHFIGGFLAAPIALTLAVSGILFAWNPQIDALRFGAIMTPSSTHAAVPLSEQVQAARDAHPDWKVHSVVPGHAVSWGPDVNTAVLMDPPGGENGFSGPTDGVNVYVDQATGRATGEIKVSDSSDSVLRNLHSNWTLGDGPRPLTELAGTWFLVSLLTGLYLWLPGLRRRGAAAFTFRRSVKGRRQSKDWHNFVGVAFVVPMIFLAITGLTWTQFAGERYQGIKAALAVPGDLQADTALPKGANDGAAPANIDKVGAAAAHAGLQNPVRITAPSGPGSGWVAASEDARFPIAKDQVVVDGSSGTVTGRVDYSDENWFNKLSTAGIAFHQAQLFGTATQVFMTLLAIAVIVLIVFGYRMWWQRRPQGGMGAPPPLRGWARNAPLGLVLVVVLLAWLLPTLGLALLVWLVLERAFMWARLARGRPTAARRGRHPAPLRPGIEAYKAAAIGVLGLAMVLGPHIGDGDAELDTIPRLAAWAWSVPLGVVLLAAGLIGLYAMFTVQGRPTDSGARTAGA
jgi:uncharacterized iron-regulated membrane protein